MQGRHFFISVLLMVTSYSSFAQAHPGPEPHGPKKTKAAAKVEEVASPDVGTSADPNNMMANNAGSEVLPPEDAPKKLIDTPINYPPPKKTRPVLKTLPPSLPVYKVNAKPTRQVDLSGLKPIKSRAAHNVDLSYFLSEGELTSDGEIVEIESGHSSASIFQNVFVKLKEGHQKKYFVVKTGEQLPDLLDKRVDSKAGLVEVQGEIEIGEVVNAQENIYRATVLRNISPIEVGTKLLPGAIPQVNISKTNLASSAPTRVIGGEFNRERWVMGSGSLIFLDGGRSQGLQEGQTLPIFSTTKNRNKKSVALQADRKIGEVKIVHLTENFATGYTLKTSEEIVVGDEVGAQSQVASSESTPPPPQDVPSVEQAPTTEEPPTEDLTL